MVEGVLRFGMADAHADKLWDGRTAALLRCEMKRRGVSYRDLAERMRAHGLGDSDEKTLRTKLARSTFRAGFFLQVLAALGVEKLDLSDLKLLALDGAAQDDAN